MRNILFILLGLILVACGGPKDDIPSANNHGLLASKIDSLYNSYYNNSNPGAAILIAYEGRKIVNKAYGLRNLSTKEASTTTTNLRSGSLAKQFTALGILTRIIHDNAVNKDDNFFKYIDFQRAM